MVNCKFKFLKLFKLYIFLKILLWISRSAATIPNKSLPKSDALERILVEILAFDFVSCPQESSIIILTKMRSYLHFARLQKPLLRTIQ